MSRLTNGVLCELSLTEFYVFTVVYFKWIRLVLIHTSFESPRSPGSLY